MTSTKINDRDIYNVIKQQQFYWSPVGPIGSHIQGLLNHFDEDQRVSDVLNRVSVWNWSSISSLFLRCNSVRSKGRSGWGVLVRDGVRDGERRSFNVLILFCYDFFFFLYGW